MTQLSMYVVCLAVALMLHSAAQAAELKVFASRAIWTVLTAIGPEFEKVSGHKLNTTTGLSPEFFKVTIPNDDISAELVAKGEVELGIVAVTQAFTTHGVELVGLLPPELQISTDFAGAISAASGNPDAARSLLIFLTGPKAKETIRTQGMEPL
jgi:ABC-type molybdate transport system substrate-binding protein